MAELVSEVRTLADSRRLNLDLSLQGRPHSVSQRVESSVVEAVHTALEIASLSEELQSLSLSVEYRDSGIYIKIDHDGTFDAASRAAAETSVVSTFARLGASGGGVVFSLGRGFGMRLEITAPYNGVTIKGAPIAPSPENEELEVPGVRGTAPGGARPDAALVERLTTQEDACLALLAVGYSNKEIANRLHISTGTVKFHLAQIYQKRGVQGRGRGAAVARARELGLIFD